MLNSRKVFTGGPYWIEGHRLATMPRPRPEDFRRLRASGIDVLVSLLEPNEATKLGLAREKELCEEAGIELVSFPIRDHGVPASMEETRRFAETLCGHLDAARGVAIHCYAGIGRSSLIAACVLVLRGHDSADAFARISKARGFLVPDNVAQENFVATLTRERSDTPPRAP